MSRALVYVPGVVVSVNATMEDAPSTVVVKAEETRAVIGALLIHHNHGRHNTVAAFGGCYRTFE